MSINKKRPIQGRRDWITNGDESGISTVKE